MVQGTVQYIDLTEDGELVIDPTYSPIEPESVYTALEPQKLAGMPLGSYAARPGGGVDAVWTYGGFKRQDTFLTGLLLRDAKWRAKLGFTN